MITPQEIADWRENPTTLKILSYFRKLREEAKENLANGSYDTGNPDYTNQKMIDVAGMCKAYKELLDISYEDFVQEYDLETKEKKEEYEGN